MTFRRERLRSHGPVAALFLITFLWPVGSTGPRCPRETLNDFNELVVRSAIGIAKLVEPMFVREAIQAH